MGIGPKSKNSNRALLTMTRSIQKFFAHQMSTSSSDTTTPTDGHVENTMDVGAVLHDVDEILDHRSLEEGRLLLRGMVADLLKEMDVLRYQYDALQSQFQNVKEERDLVNHIYNDKIETLTLTLQTAIQQKQLQSSTGITKPTASTTESSLLSTEMKQHMEQGNIVSADVATTLTIQTLLQKIESLHLVTLQQQDTIVQCQEQMEDLKSDNEAKTYKIMALEQQFTHINQKRTKVLTKFGSSGSKATPPSLMLRPMRFPPQPIVTVATTKTVSQCDNEEEVVFQKIDDDDRDDFNSTYQDHKENIIANIMLNPPPHRVPPNDHLVATCDVVEPDEEVTVTKNPEKTVVSPLEPPLNVIVATLDMPDDEAHDKENMVATTTVTVASPIAALLQQQTAPPAGVVVTPPPATRSTKPIQNTTTMILGHRSNNTVEVSRPLSHKNPSERTKQRHGPRAPRLVQLVEQV